MYSVTRRKYIVVDLTKVMLVVLIKKVYVGPFKKDFIIIGVISHTKNIDTEIVYPTMCGKLKRI